MPDDTPLEPLPTWSVLLHIGPYKTGSTALQMVMHERRAELAKDMDSIRDILHDGNKRANAIAEETLDQVREAMGMKY